MTTGSSGRAAAIDSLPGDYHERIELAEQDHWWHRGMRAEAAALLEDRLKRPGQRVLDAGCGAGGFLRWLLDRGSFADAAGTDAVDDAIARARRRLPDADLRVCLLPELPFETDSFDLVVCNDVLQHLTAGDASAALRSFRRVLADSGCLLLRTSGARLTHGTRASWGAYDRRSLAAELVAAGFHCERVTHANLAPSLLAAGRGRTPADLVARQGHGVPQRVPSWQASLGRSWLALEAKVIRHTRVSLPYGHTLLALATIPGAPRRSRTRGEPAT